MEEDYYGISWVTGKILHVSRPQLSHLPCKLGTELSELRHIKHMPNTW